jgi:hypothetical protein
MTTCAHLLASTTPCPPPRSEPDCSEGRSRSHRPSRTAPAESCTPAAPVASPVLAGALVSVVERRWTHGVGWWCRDEEKTVKWALLTRRTAALRSWPRTRVFAGARWEDARICREFSPPAISPSTHRRWPQWWLCCWSTSRAAKEEYLAAVCGGGGCVFLSFLNAEWMRVSATMDIRRNKVVCDTRTFLLFGVFPVFSPSPTSKSKHVLPHAEEVVVAR